MTESALKKCEKDKKSPLKKCNYTAIIKYIDELVHKNKILSDENMRLDDQFGDLLIDALELENKLDIALETLEHISIYSDDKGYRNLCKSTINKIKEV